jgi:hypothetical protein
MILEPPEQAIVRRRQFAILDHRIRTVAAGDTRRERQPDRHDEQQRLNDRESPRHFF